MPFIISSRENGRSIRICYEDMGQGPVIVFISGWPLSHQMWEYQMTPLREKGYRCIAYDRRGFGQSDQALDDYSYNALASDLNALLEALDVKDIMLVGFSMGGGEVIRYLTNYGTERVKKIVLVSSIIPYMLQTDTNPNGVPKEMFDEFEKQIRKDRPGFFIDFGKAFYGFTLLRRPVSEGILQWSQSMAIAASQKATIECMKAFSQTDFREEVMSVNVPTLIIHGDEDKTVPIKTAGHQAAKLISGSSFKVYEGSPHGLFVTDAEKLTNDLEDFIKS